jgi:hypothetical protein
MPRALELLKQSGFGESERVEPFLELALFK